MIILHFRIHYITSELSNKGSIDSDSTDDQQQVENPNAATKRDKNCEPVQKLIYIKTHKTGSTTLASILGRFGYLRNLSFAFGRGGHTLSNTQLFHSSLLYEFPNTTRIGYDMFVNHVRYNRQEMDALIPGAKYISIIRNPVSHLESAFGYFNMWKSLNITTQNPFETFLMDPRKYYAMKRGEWVRSRNALLFDFGFNHVNDENITTIFEKIDELSKEIDLMMITEYFDKSLILLKRLMCWDFEDILYIPHLTRNQSQRAEVSTSMAEKIRVWSAGDAMLYNHFNRTFWKKVADYGPTFQNDLAHFQSLKTKVFEECVDGSTVKAQGGRVEELTLKIQSKYCTDLARIDRGYSSLILREMKKRVLKEVADFRESSTG